MAKAIITNRIYLDNPGPELTKVITSTLTYKIVQDSGNPKFKTVETIRNYKRLTNGILSIPQGRIDLIPEGYEVLDKRVQAQMYFPEANFPLLPEQVPVYNEVNDSCLINALPGWGKSFTALYIAKKFGCKTLIITHTLALRDQWMEEIEKLFSIKAGIIGSGKLDYADHAITVANVQTLKKHADLVGKEFGTVIGDEIHHCPSSTFSECLDKLHGRYRVGLSGTLIRKDKKHVVLPDYFGSHVIRPPESNTMRPSVVLVKTGITLKPNVPWTDKISALIANKDYQSLVANIAMVQIAKGHKVLVIADRVEFLETIGSLVGEDCVVVSGEIGDRGEAKQQILDGEKKAIIGSRQIFSEGISIPPLSCVVLAAPMNNDALLEQIVGRVMRLHDGKLNPIVIDLQFAGWADKKQNDSRLSLYLRKGWAVETL